MLTLITVVLSAYIRMAEVGVGCEPWPECYAQLDGDAEQKGVTVLTDQGRDMSHYAARVAHRYIASILGLFIVAIFFVALRQGANRSTTLAVPLAIFGLTVFLSLLGYYTPTRSNPLITMGNLLGGMGLLGLLWWLMQREAGAQDAVRPPPGARRLALIALVLILMQIVLGGWSSANYATPNCPGIVQCEGQPFSREHIGNAFNPMRNIALDEQGQVLREDALGLMSMAHRLFALLTAAYLAWMVRRFRDNSALLSTLKPLSLFSIGQILLGVISIYASFPLLLVTLHNSFAAGLLVCSINLLHRLSPARASPPRQ